MKFKFSSLIVFLVIFVPFEVMILKYLPVTDTVYSFLRFSVEIIIYIIAGILFARYLSAKKIPNGTSIDRPLLLFIIYALAITFINQAPLLQSLIGLRTLLRYLPLMYIIAFINFDESMPRKILHSIIFVAGIQSVIAIYQHYAGLGDFWYPRASDLEIGGKQVSFRLLATGFGGGREIGTGIGTFGDSVFLALFLVIAFAVTFATMQKKILIPRFNKITFNIILLLIIIALFFTYSRGSVLIALFTIPVILFISGGRKKTFIYLTVGLIIISPIIIFGVFSKENSDTYINPKLKYTDPLANIASVFSSSYVDKTMQFSRGAVLTEVGGYLVSSFKLLGYSPAQEFALEKASTKLFGSNMPINNLPIINDVYWVAFIIYYGLIGLAIFFYILYKIFKAALFVFRNSPDPYFRIFALAMVAIIIIAIPYSLILRTFVFRSFSFYFWMIAGLVFAEWRRLQIAQKQAIEVNQ